VAAVTRRPGRRRAAFSWLLAAAIASAALGVLAIAWALGIGARPGEPGAAGPPPGSIAVPVAAARLPAYTELQLEHLVDPKTGGLAVVYLPEGSLLASTIVRPEALLGRVLAADKPPGRVFTEDDFLPPGTRPGLVAGIPPGKRAMRVEATAVGGLVGLSAGDRFDVVASFPAGARGDGGGRVGQARVQTVVADGVVVQPLATRAVPAARDAKVVQEIVIAVAPEEVPQLAEALAVGARLDCVPRSGQPGEAAEADARATSGSHVIDRIDGSRRELVAVPRAAPELRP
jgi:Flp pilus assembly protein CpaB